MCFLKQCLDANSNIAILPKLNWYSLKNWNIHALYFATLVISSVWKVRVALALLIVQWMYLWCKPRETSLVREMGSSHCQMCCDRDSLPVRITPASWSCGGWQQCCCYCLHAGRLPSCCARWNDGALPTAFYCIHHTMRCFGMPCVGVMPTLRQCHRLRSFIPYGRNLRRFVVDGSCWTVWYQVSEQVQCILFG